MKNIVKSYLNSCVPRFQMMIVQFEGVQCCSRSVRQPAPPLQPASTRRGHSPPIQAQIVLARSASGPGNELCLHWKE